jgi:hypothetical protein
MSDFTYRSDQELPSLAFEWLDRDGAVIDFSSGWTFQCELVDDDGVAQVTQTTGITGDSTSPNVTVAWATGALADLDGIYRIHLRARDGSNSDRFFRPNNWPTMQVIATPSTP